MSDTHSIRRTSPKGPGQQFIGTCVKCGATGLTFSDMNDECANPSGVTQDEALLTALETKGNYIFDSPIIPG